MSEQICAWGKDMSGKKVAGIIVLVLGVIGLAVSLLANVIQVGPIGESPGFGMQQTIGTIIGAVFIIVGTILAVRK